MQIERRNMEISEILRKLLELDAANKAEAAALMRLAEDSATSPGPAGPGSRRPADDSRPPAPDATTSSGGDGPEAGRAGVKRRNPFSRAVSAIRKKFARPHQEGIPAAAWNIQCRRPRSETDGSGAQNWLRSLSKTFQWLVHLLVCAIQRTACDKITHRYNWILIY